MITKKLGEIVELKFQLKCFELGLIVSKPFGDSTYYDFILDNGHDLYRIQIKSTNYLETANRMNGYRFAMLRGCNKKTLYTDKEVDFIVGYVTPKNIWYIFPISKILGIGTIRVYPHKENSGSYEFYRERWELIK